MKKIYKNKKDMVQNTILETDSVLDVGFWGQGISIDDPNWVHGLILNQSNNVHGIDISYEEDKLKKYNDLSNYSKQDAQNFEVDRKFDVVIAADLIEHLPNPGNFLDSCRKALKDDGKLILTTPNCFNLFNMAGKITRSDPIVNYDHTCYFNEKTLRQLLDKTGWSVDRVDFLYTVGVTHKESLKKKFLNAIYFILSSFTTKFSETLVIVARKND